MYVTELVHVCDITHSYVWHDSFICVTWLIHMCDVTHAYVGHESFIYVTELGLIHMWDMTHSYVRHDSFICETWLIHTRHDSFICVTWLVRTWQGVSGSKDAPTLMLPTHLSHMQDTWLIHKWDMPHSYVWHDSFICGTRPIVYETWLIQMWDTTHPHVTGCPPGSRDSPILMLPTHVVLLWDLTDAYLGHRLFVCETRLVHMCDVKIVFVRHNSCCRHTLAYSEIWLMHIWYIDYLYVRHESFICATWRLCLWDITHGANTRCLSLRYDLFIFGMRGGGLGSRPKKMYGERLGDGVEYHLMKPTPRR